MEEQQRELLYSLFALFMKLGLLAIGSVSVVKLGLVSHQRVDRYSEISSVLNTEIVKLVKLQSRFDKFFTIGGEKRLMSENEQWITPNSLRVVWQ